LGHWAHLKETKEYAMMTSAMSAIGPKQTFRVALHMSAFGGKADINGG